MYIYIYMHIYVYIYICMHAYTCLYTASSSRLPYNLFMRPTPVCTCLGILITPL